ncbi:glycoside hydrolase family 32 protein [Microbacterium sp.]|uniref:glycoside hydrolase family 32 protein n=1 Tax=Microbacterium sp. TaxID=51671 RepID=UPI0025D04412|nr:glycoside hydrolase family 32 protein [Microbacterium sp.]
MRPRFHFTAEAGWINDPHGITYREGRYHLFFQYCPGRTTWNIGCHWGHAAGDDLLSLAELKIALRPGDGDDGVWTGALVDDGDRARIFYTSVQEADPDVGRIRVADAVSADWIEWKKGVIVATAPAELDLTAFRDPFIRREGREWRMFVGSSIRGETAVALTFTSPDLDRWTFDGIALERASDRSAPVWTGTLWECPQIFETEDGAAMVMSVWDAGTPFNAAYAIGRYANGRFQASKWAQLSYGACHYAPTLFFDSQGQPCLSFWMRDIADEGQGWAGALSIPYRLSFVAGALLAVPHPDVTRHRGAQALSGRVAGVAADIEWDAAEGTLTAASAGVPFANLRTADRHVVIEVGGVETSMPLDGCIRMIVDGTTLEVSSGVGIFGARITLWGESVEVTASAGLLSVYVLG